LQQNGVFHFGFRLSQLLNGVAKVEFAQTKNWLFWKRAWYL